MDWQAAFIARARAAYTRTYWVNAAQGAVKPYATLLDVTELRPQTLTDWDLELARVQIDVWGLTYADVQSGMAALLRSWRGLHRFFALLMLAAVLLHAGVAWYYGYRWIFG